MHATIPIILAIFASCAPLSLQGVGSGTETIGCDTIETCSTSANGAYSCSPRQYNSYQKNIIRTFWKVLIIGKKNMFQKIKLVKTQRKGIYNGRFKCAKV